MNPAERLRAVMRHGFDDDRLAVEAAEALAGFAVDPAGLVVACRRVVAHHPDQAPLWWVAARVLAAPDPVAACHDAVRLLDADRTSERLAASLPLLDDEWVAAVGWPRVVDRALADRADLAAVAVSVAGLDARAAVRRGSRPDVPVVSPDGLGTCRVARLLVPALAVGPDRALVPAGARDVLAVVAPGAGEAWLVAGVGRALPRPLYEAAEREAAGAEPPGLEREALAGPEVLPLSCFDRVAGPRGAEAPADAAARPDCPVAPELLRPL